TGSVTNAQQLVDGNLDLAFMQSDVAYNLYVGRNRFALPWKKIRGICSLYIEDVHLLVRKNSGIEKIEDLRGRRVRTGTHSGESISTAEKILKAAGIQINEIDCLKLSYDDTKNGLTLGTDFPGSIDAAFITSGVPSPFVNDISEKINIISIPLIRSLKEGDPFFVYDAIPAGKYGNNERITTPGIPALLVTSEAFDSKHAYKLTRTLYQKADLIQQVYVQEKNRIAFESKQESATEGMGTPNEKAGFDDNEIDQEKSEIDSLLDILSATNGMGIPVEDGSRLFYSESSFKIKILMYKAQIIVVAIGFSIVCFLGLFRHYAPKHMLRDMKTKTILTFLVMYILSALIMYSCEGSYNTYFSNLYESFWSIIVYILSGFENRSPMTGVGRALSMMVFIMGMCMSGLIVGKITSHIVIMHKETRMPTDLKKHIVICNWNERGARIINEIHSKQAEPETDIIVITEKKTDEKKLRGENKRYFQNVFFVEGNPVFHSILKYAKLKSAKTVLVLADEDIPDPDAKSAMVTLAVQQFMEEYDLDIRIVVETINHRTIPHIKKAGAHEVICADDFGLGILAQSTLHNELSKIYYELLQYSNDTNEIYIVDHQKCPKLLGKSFLECLDIVNSSRSPNNPVILLGIRRGSKVILNPKCQMVENEGQDIGVFRHDDALIVMAFNPPNLSHLSLEPAN
ncbi:MAG: TAXI family TRAP transporter solute-binding subunit, partial [Anaerohalosphaera sp.]|nr:TAXI family TRAP transporter solute-binding subunit [Anaerohalosphaera sp.]